MVWAEWAAAIHAGHGDRFNSGLPFYPPAVAYLIAWLSPGGGGPPNFVAIKMLWCVMNAAAVALAYLAVAREFGRRIALIASALGAFSFGLGVISTSLNSETPYLLAVVALVLAGRRLAERPTWATAGAFGVLHGAANMIRAEHTLLAAMMVGWVVWRWWRAGWIAERRWRSLGVLAAVGVAFAVTCLPWSLHATRANIRYNRGDPGARFMPDYDRMTPAWTPDARAFFDGLPEFAKRDTGAYLYTESVRRGLPRVTAEDVRHILNEGFGYVPEPVRAFTLVASSGPLAFALANHPDAWGGFSKAALDARFGGDIALGIPSHLRLYNDGLGVGLGYIGQDPGRWLRNVGVKVLNFWSGVTLGVTARNLPLGRDGERRAVDMVTHEPGRGAPWRAAVTVAVLAGAVIALRRGRGGVWMIVIASKVAVTVLFFGYARQAVSILPAFLLLAAITIDAVAAWALARGVPRRLVIAVGAGGLIGLAAVDASALFARSVPRVEGPMRADPRWGAAAFVSPETVRLRFTP
ncbi:MAG: glycosyltransferase family 39 protein [Phycisphaerales bacterium]